MVSRVIEGLQDCMANIPKLVDSLEARTQFQLRGPVRLLKKLDVIARRLHVHRNTFCIEALNDIVAEHEKRHGAIVLKGARKG